MQIPLRTLFIEDSQDDTLLLVRHLTRGGYEVRWDRVDSEAKVDAAAEANRWDLIICDYSMPSFNGVEALKRFRSRGSDTPFIFVSGTIGEDAAVEALRYGAQDYVMKDNLKRLLPAVKRELQEVRDRQERRDLERQVRQLEKFESIGALAGGMAHDFNNSLGVIIGLAHLGFEEARDSESREKFRQIREQAANATGLTSQLLAFARQQLLQQRNLDLNQVIRETDKILQPTLGKQIVTELRLADNLALVSADRGQLQQLLLNLVLNARDAMTDGGRLKIETSHFKVDDAYHQSHPYVKVGDYVRLAVQDTGTGIDPETLKRIFEPFFTTKEPGKGTGLGLSSVFGTVKQHGGFVDVESEVGRGTTFLLHFPVVYGAVEEVGALLPAKQASRDTETILLAEDNAMLAEIAALILGQPGFKVVVAHSGDEALRLFQADPKKFDLVMLDVVMPGLTGPQALEKMLAIRPDLPCVFTTGHSADALQLTPQLLHRVRFLQKPYEPSELAAFVRKVIEQAKSRH